jgi:hypothetical protein
MYRLEVVPSMYGYSYHVYCKNEVIQHGYRTSEQKARDDGYEDLMLCRAFAVGYKQD